MFPKGEAVPIVLIREWIDESYRAIAPKKIAALLDAKNEPTATAESTKKRKSAATTAKKSDAKKTPKRR